MHAQSGDYNGRDITGTYKNVTGHARWNVTQVGWVYFTCPLSKEPVEDVWKGEAQLPRAAGAAR